ncbi:AAA family ATPase [Nonomuraea sp. NPDC050227]|uniref:AAA family ATPase n=1 Tax=Nonomuraea sp. NPDC050227 TaxID=3364360 RepID=UPI0037BBF7AB
MGKTALIEHLAGVAAGCRILRVAGVQSEMELAFAGLHQLCVPMLTGLERLPGPQRKALRTAFGLVDGIPPDRFLVGLALLSLLADAAEERPVVCVIDDVHWLDQASAQALGFVARRLAADPVALVFGTRTATDELAGLPEMEVSGLAEPDALALLNSVLTTPLDDRIKDQIVAETRGSDVGGYSTRGGVTEGGRAATVTATEKSLTAEGDKQLDSTLDTALCARRQPAAGQALR